MTTHLVGSNSSYYIFIQSLNLLRAHCKGKQLYVDLKEYTSLTLSAKREAYMGGLIILGNIININ